MNPHRVLIVVARFYEDLADHLTAGAVAVLQAEAVDYELIAVPGSFELPLAMKFAIDGRRADRHRPPLDGCIALGCVIRGETDHYEHICREASRGLLDVALQLGLPLGFGVLTCETYAQALERADPARGNKGADAARACVSLMAVQDAFGSAGLYGG